MLIISFKLLLNVPILVHYINAFCLYLLIILRGTDLFFRKISNLIAEIFPNEEQVDIG